MMEFYCALLANDASVFLQSHSNKTSRGQLRKNIRARLNLECQRKEENSNICKGPRKQRSATEAQHVKSDEKWIQQSERFKDGILEESRHAIAEALYERWNNHQGDYRSGLELDIEFEESNEEINGVSVSWRSEFFAEDIKISHHFTRQDENNLLRPGTIIELRPAKRGRITGDHLLLGILSHNVWKTEEEGRQNRKKGCKAIELFIDTAASPINGRYRIHPLTSLLSFARQIEACSSLTPRLYPDLMLTRREVASTDLLTNDESFASDESKGLGNHGEQLTNGPSDDKAILVDGIVNEKLDGEQNVPITELNPDGKAAAPKSIAVAGNGLSGKSSRRGYAISKKCPFVIPKLNESQEKSLESFLRSRDGSVILVQGPPGTGKSTLLTATVCRFLLERHADGVAQPRLMVCAPSNKAVAVLAARYLDARKHTKTLGFRAAMVGDRDKMLPEDRWRFKDIFVYDWVSSILEELRQVCGLVLLQPPSYVRRQVENLSNRLYCNIPQYAFHPIRGVDAIIERILQNIQSLNSISLEDEIQTLGHRLKELEREIQATMLERANVIFCTLSSAGSSIIKRSKTVEGLIIDEAAAAIEPESYIPIASSRPRRIMVVGDPKQLPATVLSPDAKTFGLGKSLQERLIVDEMQPYTMLNVQYRMKPEISRFPSSVFYDSELCDGHNVLQQSYNTPVYSRLVVDQPYCFVHVDGTETRSPFNRSFHNTEEAEKIVALLMDLRRKNCTGVNFANRPRGNNEPWFSIRRVRVITFYQAQVDLISSLLQANNLHQIGVSTVDSSQGSEADLIIVSFVRTGGGGGGETMDGGVGFLSDVRRLNVALTRAKHKLICIGNSAALAKAVGRGTDTIQSLILNAIDRGVVVSSYSPKFRIVRPPPPTTRFWMNNNRTFGNRVKNEHWKNQKKRRGYSTQNNHTDQSSKRLRKS